MERRRGGSGRRQRASSRSRPPQSKCKSCCRKFTAFLFSHVGLCVLVVGYSVLGAFTFKALEGPHENEKTTEVIKMRDATVQNLWEITDRLNVLYRENWTAAVSDEIIKFQRKIIEAVKDGYDGKETRGVKQWSFSGAFLYSLTVITTIGYGNIAPRTAPGKLVTILYAIVGIPLMLLYLTNIGDILAKAFRYLYGKLCTCSGGSGGGSQNGGGSRRAPVANHNHTSKFATINHHHPHAAEAYRLHSLQNNHIAPPVCCDGSAAAEHKLHLPPNHDDPISCCRMNETLGEDLRGITSLDLEEAGLYSASAMLPDIQTTQPKQRVSVPITLCFLIMISYISGGGLLFSLWEKWGFLDGSYFCFVTLSTIGFGDLVPGDSVVTDEGSQEKLVICSLYLLTGMALIAMCFNLMQEEVVHKVRICGQRIGLLKNPDEEEDEVYPERS